MTDNLSPEQAARPELTYDAEGKCSDSSCPCHKVGGLTLDELYKLESNHPPLVGPRRNAASRPEVERLVRAAREVERNYRERGTADIKALAEALKPWKGKH
jgi:hypothetical protein